jgi:hypothetical protein
MTIMAIDLEFELTDTPMNAIDSLCLDSIPLDTSYHFLKKSSAMCTFVIPKNVKWKHSWITYMFLHLFIITCEQTPQNPLIN